MISTAVLVVLQSTCHSHPDTRASEIALFSRSCGVDKFYAKLFWREARERETERDRKGASRLVEFSFFVFVGDVRDLLIAVLLDWIGYAQRTRENTEASARLLYGLHKPSSVLLSLFPSCPAVPMVGVMDARSVLKAARLFGLCTLLGPSSGGVFAGSHAPQNDRRVLQTSSNIVYIEAVVGTAFTTDEESGLQLQVLCLPGFGLWGSEDGMYHRNEGHWLIRLLLL